MAGDPYKFFRIEARELVEQLAQGTLALEKAPATPELVSRLLRFAHTLKGAARVVKQKEIADLAHAVEDTLGPVRETSGLVARQVIDALLRQLDDLKRLLEQLGAPPSPTGPTERQPSAGVEALRTIRADALEMDELLEGVTEVGVQLASVRRETSALQQVQHLADLLGNQRAIEGRKAKVLTDELRALVGTLGRALTRGLDQAERELSQVRESTERLRLLPARLMFDALERTVRDAARSLGKQVAFEAQGGGVMLAADVLNTVQGALVQAARNAVAHGIESNAERQAAGKPSSGRVTVEVTLRGNRVAFSCRDDGAGVDVEAVRRAAERKGAPMAEGVSPEALFQQLLRGGLSTAARVSEVSGRGVGLDVAREAAERLGGTVALRSERGQGATLELVVPVSLSSLEALVIEAAGRRAAIPLHAVRSTARVRPHEVVRTAEGEALVLGGVVVPLLSLAAAFGGAKRPSSTSMSAVVLEHAGRLVAVGVERLVGTHSLVLRPLPELAPLDPAVAGVSIDGEGNPQLLLDPEGLVARARQLALEPHAAPIALPPILVIDDSLTTRMLEQSILESAGYEVDLATSAEEGLAKAQQRAYGLFLVDVEMPGMDGFTFVQQTRAHPVLQRVPAILVTSRADAEDRARGEAVGAAAYIVKGEFDQTDLLSRIRRLVG